MHARTIPRPSSGSTCAGRSPGMSPWRPDPCLPGFEALELRFPDDYDGAVVATLVRLPAGAAPRGAVLYVHGFADYFFQHHLAERFAAEGYAFYALDLRKLGRFYPFFWDDKTLRADYVNCLLDEGWEFDLDLKPPLGFGVYYGWLGAMTDAHARVHRGLQIACPVPAMHSDEADIVLDWRDM